MPDRPDRADAVVTGAAGWLGQNLVRTLAGADRRVRCLVHDPAEAPLLELVDPAVEVVVGDTRDPVALDRLFRDVGRPTVFHAAAVIHPGGRTRPLFDVNVGGTQLVLDRARRADAHRFVHVSSNSPFGANPSPEHRFTEESPYNPYLAYGQSKHDAELLVQRTFQRGDLATVIVRAPWFYGPYQPERQTRFLATVRRGRFPLLGNGTNRRSMVYTGNLVQGLLRAEATEAAAGRSYWIADSEPYTMNEVLSTVRRALAAEGLPVSSRQLRLPAAAGIAAEGLDRLLQSRGRYVQALHVLGELKDTIACDVGRARAELGYDPSVDLEAGMRASIRWCLERGMAL
ncbi:MAG: NAD-dependent epimerase/dehydratase family protein [Acidimicrobiales bacterium]